MHGLIPALEPVARIAVATLFNSLWEAAVLAFAVWLLLRALPNLNAATRYAAWCLALAGSLLLPVATAVPQISVQRPSAAAAVPASAQRFAVSSTTHSAARTDAPAGTAAKPLPAAATAAPARLFPQRLRFALPEFAAFALFALWVLAALLLLVRLCVNLLRLEHLKRDALPLPVDYRDQLSQWTLAEKGGREVRLCVCEGIDVPVAVGLFDSMILIPQHLLETLTPQEIDQIMLHELGHLRRADDWTNGLQRIVQALFFFNPAILYVAQQLDLEREVACDDWVLRQTKSVKPYASCLTKMAEVTAWPHRPLAAPGVFVTRRGLSVRVERLLNAGRNIRTSISFGPAGAVVAALVVLFFVLQSVAPSFAFTLSAEPGVSAHVASAHVAVVPAKTATPSPAPRETTLVVPAIHEHVPGRTIKIPPVNVDVPEQRVRMVIPPSPKMPDVHVTMPPDFGKKINADVSQALSASMAAVNASMKAAFHTGGKFDCTGCDYSGKNLAGRSFHGKRLNGADFSRSNLRNADFSNAELVGVDFSNSDLRGVNFANAVLTGCDLTHSDLTGANFSGASMLGCDVDARSLAPTQARDILAACHTGCDLSGANLSGQSLRGISLTGVDLSGADLRGTDFSHASLRGVTLSGARLDGANFTGASLVGCDLTGVDLSKVDLSGAKMTGDKLTSER